MAILSFSLTPAATGRISELLTCLAKFGEAVSLEARGEKLTLTALNLSRTAYASYALDSRAFFIEYDFHGPSQAGGGDRFTCQLYNKALQSVFKGRMADARGRETAIERCDVSVEGQPDKTECRLIVEMLSKHGVTKTYRLNYEAAEVMHALFDKTAATQGWRISSRVLREYVEYFGPKTEQLDFVAHDGKVTLTSFTEKISDGKEVLKQPLETAIGIHTEDFEDFHMQENMHIVISVKDFRAIVTHSETLHAPISAYFSQPTRPLQFTYQNFGIHCEFTLMTTGDRGTSVTPNPKFISTRATPSRQPSIPPAQSSTRSVSGMPPPARPHASRPLGSQTQRLSLREHAQTASNDDHDPDPDSLFVPQDDNEDHAWEESNYDHEDDEMLGWNPNNQPGSSMRPTIRDVNRRPELPKKARGTRDGYPSQESGLEPTQRLSEVRVWPEAFAIRGREVLANYFPAARHV
ncbi:related to rad9 [Lecanosticta acicola]|uniref:DNA repair protein rad9 n=1 Tax=Lecanosticta acicola TaxID=111012 RepID=A0AAI9E7N3_9PEZI|nr:related to rad9 [Lecanosticta acicola]